MTILVGTSQTTTAQGVPGFGSEHTVEHWPKGSTVWPAELVPLLKPDSTWKGWPYEANNTRTSVAATLETQLWGRSYTLNGGLIKGHWVGALTIYREDTLVARCRVAGDLVHGPLTLFYADSLPSFVGKCLAGELEGMATWYYPTGKKQASIYYEDDAPAGEHAIWYEDGVLKEKGTWEQGKRLGTWEYKAPNGRPCLTEVYDSAGKLSQVPLCQTMTGKSLSIGTFKNGQGVLKRYDMTGSLLAEEPYSNGRINGVVSIYDSAGKVAERHTYVLGTLHGQLETYWPEVQKLQSRTTIAQGIKQGLYDAWHPSGKPAAKGWYKNGQKDSLWITYHESGTRASVGLYKLGEPEGLHEQWFENGAPRAIYKYVEHKPDSIWTTYYANGNVMLLEEYDMGERVGTWTSYYTDGKEKELTDYIGGKADGRHQTWFVNGQQEVDELYSAGLLNGPAKYWYANGKPAGKGSYTMGLKEGAWEYWHGNGKPKTSEVYKNGTLQSATAFLAPDGKVISTHTVVAGNGRRQWYHPGGILASDGSYKTGQKHGLWQYWTPEGKPMAFGQYHLGKEVGTWKYWQGSQVRSKTYPAAQ